MEPPDQRVLCGNLAFAYHSYSLIMQQKGQRLDCLYAVEALCQDLGCCIDSMIGQWRCATAAGLWASLPCGKGTRKALSLTPS